MIPRRRSMVLGALGAIAASRQAAAQTKRLPRLAIIATTLHETEIVETGPRNWRVFFGELRRRGFEEGRNLGIERWSARGDMARLPGLGREVASTKPDVVYTNNLGAAGIQSVTTSVPVVVVGTDLINMGLVDSLARPGRNVTGVSIEFAQDLGAKRLELLRETSPTLSRIALLVPRFMWDWTGVRQVRETAPRLGVTLISALLDDPVQPPGYRRAFAEMIDQGVEAVLIGDAAANFVYAPLIAELATANRLPMMAQVRELVDAGGLMSYGSDAAEWFRVAAFYVARVLQGEKPAEMPIRLIDKYELVINLKAAKALGLTIPPAILARADEVIE